MKKGINVPSFLKSIIYFNSVIPIVRIGLALKFSSTVTRSNRISFCSIPKSSQVSNKLTSTHLKASFFDMFSRNAGKSDALIESSSTMSPELFKGSDTNSMSWEEIDRVLRSKETPEERNAHELWKADCGNVMHDTTEITQ